MNILIENIAGIAEIALTKGVDWSVAVSMWAQRNPELAAKVKDADSPAFLRYVNGVADEHGNTIHGKPVRFRLDENGAAVRDDA